MNQLHTFPISRLSEAFTGHRCVTAWLGYGNVLFLGFGDNVLPEHDEGGRHTRPPYELETNYADWRIEGPTKASLANSDRATLTAAAQSLLNEQVLSCEVAQRTRLRISFTGGKLLAVDSWSATEGLADSWCLKSPDGQILAVAKDGRFVVVGANVPVRDWFGDVVK
jgi:hypothetical protein